MILMPYSSHQSRTSPPTFSSFLCPSTATTEIYTLSLHDALPIHAGTFSRFPFSSRSRCPLQSKIPSTERCVDRKSTRLNSSHSQTSYAVFCLKKKKAQCKPTAIAGRRSAALHLTCVLRDHGSDRE